MNEKASSFTVINKEGKEVKCDVLFTFDSEETGKSYMVYTDNTKDDKGNEYRNILLLEYNEFARKGHTIMILEAVISKIYKVKYLKKKAKEKYQLHLLQK